MTWLVIGAGVSGLGAAKLLRARGHAVRVSDRGPVKADKAAAFRALGADLRGDGHALDHLDRIEGVVLSPGLPPTHMLVAEAMRRGIPMFSEIDLALREYRGRLIGVTGTNGKSTTCAMLGHVLAKRGVSVAVGGNFGDPPSAMIAEGRAPDWLVLELSSYQLEQSHLVRADAAIFTSFSHDHLARHGSMEGYLRAKWRVFAGQPPEGIAVLPDYIFALGQQAGLKLAAHAVVIDRSVPGRPGAGYSLPDGWPPHDVLNATFALTALAHLLKVPAAELAPLSQDFKPLRHRCEPVGTFRRQPLINDSKSTNVESTLVALAAQKEPVILMMGGQGKGEPYAPILDERRKIAALVTFGATGADIANELRAHLPVHEFKTLHDALAAIGGILEKYPRGVLFSPGCASFDEFSNYEERGDFFRARMPKD